MEQLKLSDGEWKLMKTLWAGQPQTLAELVTALDADTGDVYKRKPPGFPCRGRSSSCGYT